MKTSNRIGRAIAYGGLSLALLGGMGLPLSVLAAGTSSPGKSEAPMARRQEMLAMRHKLLAQLKAEDAELQKMVAELTAAPEARKPDLEAAILTKLIAQRHEMIGDLEGMHARVMRFRHNYMPTSSTRGTGGCMMDHSGCTAQD